MHFIIQFLKISADEKNLKFSKLNHLFTEIEQCRVSSSSFYNTLYLLARKPAAHAIYPHSPFCMGEGRACSTVWLYITPAAQY